MVTSCRSRVDAVVGVVVGVVGVGSLQSGHGALGGVKPTAVMVVAAGFLPVAAACFVKRPVCSPIDNSVLQSRIQSRTSSLRHVARLVRTTRDQLQDNRDKRPRYNC